MCSCAASGSGAGPSSCPRLRRSSAAALRPCFAAVVVVRSMCRSFARYTASGGTRGPPAPLATVAPRAASAVMPGGPVVLAHPPRPLKPLAPPHVGHPVASSFLPHGSVLLVHRLRRTRRSAGRAPASRSPGGVANRTESQRLTTVKRPLALGAMEPALDGREPYCHSGLATLPSPRRSWCRASRPVIMGAAVGVPGRERLHQRGVGDERGRCPRCHTIFLEPYLCSAALPRFTPVASRVPDRFDCTSVEAAKELFDGSIFTID